MDAAKLNDWLQVIGLFGVIAGLAFVGLQMRQDQKIAMSTAYQARAETTIELLLSNSENPYWLSAQSKWAAGNAESRTPEERLSQLYGSQAMLINYENIHFQYLNGFISDEHWNRVQPLIGNILRSTPVRETYEANPTVWRQSFRDVMDGIIAEIDGDTG